MLSLLSTITFWLGVYLLLRFYYRRWKYKHDNPGFVAKDSGLWVYYYLRGWYFFDKKRRPLIESNDVRLTTLVKEGEQITKGQAIVRISGRNPKKRKDTTISFDICSFHSGIVHHTHKQWQGLSIDEELFSIETGHPLHENIESQENRRRQIVPDDLQVKVERKDEAILNNMDEKLKRVDDIQDCKVDKYDVPYWAHQYIYDTNPLQSASNEQKSYYYLFKTCFLNGEYLDIQGNSNYVFTLLFDLADMPANKDNYAKLEERLKVLAEHYPEVGRYTSGVLSKFYQGILKADSKQILESKVNDSNNQDAKWIKKGESIEIAGVTVDKGLLYVGDYFTVPSIHYHDYSWDRNRRNKSLRVLSPVISPALEVSSSPVENKPYSSFSTMTPYMRYKYLKWLSEGMNLVDVEKGFIRLYLLGLETRFFIDTECTDKDKREIIEELAKLYKSAKDQELDSIVHAFKELLSNTIICYAPKGPLEYIDNKYLFDFSDLICQLISTKIEGRELNKEVLFDIADKCYGFSDMVPEGNKDALKTQFLANFSLENREPSLPAFNQDRQQYFRCGWYLWGDELSSHDCEDVYYSINTPHLYGATSMYYSLISAANSIYWDFGKYRKLVADNNGVVTPYAVMNYPSYIDATNTPELKLVQQEIDNNTDADGYATVRVMDLIKWIKYPLREEKGIYKPYAETIERGINNLGYGISPSTKVDGDRLMYDGNCCFYKLKDTSSIKNVYKGQIIVKMAATEAMADAMHKNDYMLIDESLKSIAENGVSLQYLRAYLRQYAAIPQRPYTPKSLVDWSRNEIQSAYELLLRLSVNNGEISDKRVKVITKYCKALGINPDTVHSGIHSVMTSSEFATVEKTTGAISYSIPKPPEVINTFNIDDSRLHIMEEQTKAAQEMLSDIFTDEGEPTSLTKHDSSDVVKEILKLLFEKEVWTLSEIESICRDKGQMAGSILEKINDFSYDTIDDAVIEQDGDTIYVTLDYKEQLI